MQIFKEIVTCVLGTAAFSAILSLPKSKIVAVIIGALITGAFFAFLSRTQLSTFLATLISAIIGALYSEIMARIKKTPSTVILLPVTIPLLPGGSLYYTMYYFVNYDKKQFQSYLTETAQIGFGIALGILFVSVGIEFYRFYKQSLKNHSIL